MASTSSSLSWRNGTERAIGEVGCRQKKWTDRIPHRVIDLQVLKDNREWVETTTTSLFPIYDEVRDTSHITPEAIFLVGPPGIGKSTTRLSCIPGCKHWDTDDITPLRIDPDAIREQMPDFKACKTPHGWWIGSSRNAVLFRSIVNNIIQRLIKTPMTYPRVIYEIVGSYPKYVVDRIQQFTTAGYKIRVVKVETSRTKQRVYSDVKLRADATGRFCGWRYFSDCWDKQDDRWMKMKDDARKRRIITCIEETNVEFHKILH